MQTSMTIVYRVGSNLYVNLTNRCPCACTFCIRQNADTVYEEREPLWLEHEPSMEEVRAAFRAQDLSLYREVVFCGYGEPTEALDRLLQTADFVKKEYGTPTRLNTNGLGSLINGRNIAPLLRGRFDAVSISLNSSSPEAYARQVRPRFGAEAYPAMLAFARECTRYVPRVALTTVATTITEEDEAACAALCRELGATYRIREYAPPAGGNGGRRGGRA